VGPNERLLQPFAQRGGTSRAANAPNLGVAVDGTIPVHILGTKGSPISETHRLRFTVADDHVGVLTLDRPDKLNAMDAAMFSALHQAAAMAREAIADRSCRAVLMMGAGRAFSAGTDLSELGQQAAGTPPDDDRIAWLQEAFTVWEELDVPVVAAVHGVALGAGCQLALAAHLRLAAPTAQMGVLEARWGIVPDLGASYRLPPLVGRSRAIDMAIRARRVDAATGLAWGLVDAVLDGEDFTGAARRWVAELAAGPVLATAAAVRLMRESPSAPAVRGALRASRR
jgi:enoyl-CoA hydratase/2-(1,2-epoxy-1,2-dihydrophenyl)acetyl-CoA isomerase